VAAGTFRLAEIAEGFRFIRRHVWLWATFAAATISYLLFMGPVEILVPYLVRNSPGGTAGELGLVFVHHILPWGASLNLKRAVVQ